jgi:hypothetical protein
MSTNLKLATLAVGAQGDTVCRVYDAHVVTTNWASEIKKPASRLYCENIHR